MTRLLLQFIALHTYSLKFVVAVQCVFAIFKSQDTLTSQ